MGALTQLTAADSRQWSIAYTSNERLRRKGIKNPLGESHVIAYDDAGRIIEETAFDGRKTSYEYDAAGRVARLVYADGSHRTFRHDRRGNLLSDAGDDGSVITYSRDRMGRLAAAIHAREGGSITTTFERDALGRVIAEHQGDRVLRYRPRRAWPTGGADAAER